MRKLTTEQFIEKSKNIHGDKYDYSQSQYVDTRTKIKIVCPTHGPYEILPNCHLSKAAGCKLCYLNKIRSTESYFRRNRPKKYWGKRRNTQSFLEEIKNIHGDKYNYSDTVFANTNTKIKVFCTKHGQFEITPKTHLKGAGCIKCANENNGINQRKSQEKFIQEANIEHQNKYDYSLVKYVGTNKKVKIICPEHGIFEQQPANHLIGHNCPTCARLIPTHCGGYSEQYFTTFPNRKTQPAILYLVEIQYKTDHFYKIGITTNSVKNRFGTKKPRGMSINSIIEYETTLFQAFLLEQYFLKLLKPFKYFPNYFHNGRTECLKPKNEVISCLESYLGINIKNRIDNG